MAREDPAEKLGGHHDVVDEAQPRPDERTPARQVIVGLTAPVVEQDALSENARGQDGRQWREHERPVGCREYVNDVGPAQLGQTEEIQRLVHQRSHIGEPPEPCEPAGKAGVDRDEVHCVAVCSQRVDQCSGLNALATQDFEGRRHDRDPGNHAAAPVLVCMPYHVSSISSIQSSCA